MTHKFCLFCENKGIKSPHDHTIRDFSKKDKPIICPELLKNKCTYCHSLGHTKFYCDKLKIKNTKKLCRITSIKNTNKRERDPDLTDSEINTHNDKISKCMDSIMITTNNLKK